MNVQGSVVYHPEIDIQFRCDPFGGTLGHPAECLPAVSTYGQTDYQTEEYYQYGLETETPWIYPPQTVQRNGFPIVLTDTRGSQYVVRHALDRFRYRDDNRR